MLASPLADGLAGIHFPFRDSHGKPLTAALADRYRIEQALGAGGMATVYLAYDVRHDRHVGLKVLRPELAAVIGAERFLAEIRTTANLQHPHILPLFDSGQVDGTVFYVMPYVGDVDGRDAVHGHHRAVDRRQGAHRKACADHSAARPGIAASRGGGAHRAREAARRPVRERGRVRAGAAGGSRHHRVGSCQRGTDRGASVRCSFHWSHSGYDVSPDGSWFVFARRGDANHIVVLQNVAELARRAAQGGASPP